MAKSKIDLTFKKGCKFSGRTIGKLLQKNKKGSSESRPLRMKVQIKPSGPARFPEGTKYTFSDPSGKLTWKEIKR